MALISMRDVCIAFGGPLLLNKIQLQIVQGERVCLTGRNGMGKTTLMKLIAGDILPDSGEIVRQQGIRIGFLAQDVPREINGSVFETALNLGDRNTESHEEKQQQTSEILSRMKLNPQAEFQGLSAGMKRRVLLAGALACKPDILLLDEPTNHLDIDATVWMEEFLLRHVRTLLFVTHDRMFLQRIANRIIELDRGTLTRWDCDYKTYLERRQAGIEIEAKQNSLSDKKLASEESWIRQGVKARRTRNEGRVKALEKMRELRQARKERVGTVRMQAQEAERSGKLVIEAQELSYDYEGPPIISDFSATVMRGDKVGIIGPNGCGKSTLLHLLLGSLLPKSGKVRHGTHLQIAYFDQLRGLLDEDRTVQENIADGKDTVVIAGMPRHIIGYLKDFLFSPDRSRSPVRILSGGERNRLLLAKLFSKPSNVLVLDEPTNDLDAETLELLEELLIAYEGTVLLVSHDRAFLNNVVTGTLVFEGQGQVSEYAGGYDDWLQQRRQPDTPEKPPVRAEKQRVKSERPRKLSYKEQLELDRLPRQIETLEAEQAALYQDMADPLFYQRNREDIAKAKERLKTLENELETAFSRWEVLESFRVDVYDAESKGKR